MGGETVPEWVLTEVGRLHLHALALERHVEQFAAERPPPAHNMRGHDADLPARGPDPT